MRPVAEQARVPCFRARLTIIPVSGIDIYSYLYVSPFYMFTQRKTPVIRQEFFLIVFFNLMPISYSKYQFLFNFPLCYTGII